MKDVLKGMILGVILGSLVGYSLNILTNPNVPNNELIKLREDYDKLSESYDALMVEYQKTLGKVPLTPESLSTEIIEKEYTWFYKDNQWTISLAIPESIYDFYKTSERPPGEDYSPYVTHPYDDNYIKSIVEKINVISIQSSLTELEKVNLVICFVQSLPYTYDDVSTPFDDYPRYPLETLVDGGGDCEDTSILTAAILREMEYNVVLLLYPSHMACAVNIESVFGSYYLIDEEKYYYLETTGEGWELGEIPDEFHGVSAQYCEMIPTPIITHHWNASWDNGVLIMSVLVENVGSALAENYYVWVGFDAGNYKVWNPVESDLFSLNFGREVNIDLTLIPPNDEHTRLMVRVINDEGYYVCDSYSEWFDT